jgi:YesN/AraC family two-component response regulator
MGDSKKAIFYRQREEEVKKSIREPRMAAAVMAILMKYEHEKQGMQAAGFRQQRTLIFLISFLTITIIIIASILHSRNVRHRSKVGFLATERELRGEHQSQLDSLKTRLQEMANQDAPKKYRKSSLSRQEAHYFLKQLIETMERGKPFLDSDLTIDKLAGTLNINRSYLSQIINECGEKSFHDFINSFRVEEAKRLLLKTNEKEFSNLQIGFKVGFSSKSTFYFAFKKIAGLTPNEFRKRFPPS